jgi:hypothetical protein
VATDAPPVSGIAAARKVLAELRAAVEAAEDRFARFEAGEGLAPGACELAAWAGMVARIRHFIESHGDIRPEKYSWLAPGERQSRPPPQLPAADPSVQWAVEAMRQALEFLDAHAGVLLGHLDAGKFSREELVALVQPLDGVHQRLFPILDTLVQRHEPGAAPFTQRRPKELH